MERGISALDPVVVILPALFALVAFVMWTALTMWHRARRLRHWVDINTRLIERLGSVKELTDLAQTEFGQKLLSGLSAEGLEAIPRDRILRGAEMGIVLALVSAGLLFLGSRYESDVREVFVVGGVVALSLALGFLVSAAVSFRLIRSLGNGSAEGAAEKK